MRLKTHMTFTQNKINEMESALRGEGHSVRSFCKEASIHTSMWQRWKNGETVPNLRSWERAEATFTAMMGAD